MKDAVLTSRLFITSRENLSGMLIFATLVMALLDSFALAELTSAASLTAWGFVALEFSRLTHKQRLPIYLLLGAGTLFAAWAWWAGAHFSVMDLLSEHLKLAMLLAAVNFIRLSTRLHTASGQPGMRSFVTTLGGMHLLSSVANFSSMLLVGEQLKRDARLSALSSIILARGFSLAVLWSPFLSILPLVLEQVPGTSLHSIYPFTLGLALFGLFFTLLDARLRHGTELAHYEGYPLTRATLSLPMALIAAILTVSWLWPSLSTVAVVSLMALTTPLLLLCLRNGPTSALKQGASHILNRLADTRGEISLFLSAGFLAAAVKACLNAGLFSLPFTDTSPHVAVLVMWSITLLAHLGIHQFALVAIFAGMLADVTTSPTQMAIAYIMATSISMSGSLFSGVNFILQARFNCTGRGILRTNLPYSFMMLLAATALIYMMQLLGIH
ncbi:hypothetical protein H9C73_02325 [Marinobacterium sp. AK62]|uniref:Sodium:proton antiporter n=1 Tax=Marinobacterium alkalitolerans TaxID=1542925 RepID=A0ABS3Z775_9GAMM|nr:hypothetical protein [Marinobacterium alkalitolerans]MBP0047559.1 hypothetical protein [Marinobacterium alkalitolerans]